MKEGIIMTLETAKEIVDKYRYGDPRDEDEEFEMIEAYQYIIEELHDNEIMARLGGYYYGKKEFDLAEKYYLMADEFGNQWAAEGLGYVYYYGRTGEPNYEKAFHYYSKAAKKGYIQSTIKIADMYRNGYYVEKDMKKYEEVIEELYQGTKTKKYGNFYLPEIYTRYARILKGRGDIENAKKCLMECRWVLEQRLVQQQFFGDLSIMKWLIEDYYSMEELDLIEFGFYDLFEVMKEPRVVEFSYFEDKHEIESLMENDELVIRFDDKWYRTMEDFFMKATIDDEPIMRLALELTDFHIVHGGNTDE